jgi:hypothetical protein
VTRDQPGVTERSQPGVERVGGMGEGFLKKGTSELFLREEMCDTVLLPREAGRHEGWDSHTGWCDSEGGCASNRHAKDIPHMPVSLQRTLQLHLSMGLSAVLAPTEPDPSNRPAQTSPTALLTAWGQFTRASHGVLSLHFLPNCKASPAHCPSRLSCLVPDSGWPTPST